MKRLILTITAVLALLSLSACKGKTNPEPDPGSGPGTNPGSPSEVTSNNAAPAGFSDEGPMTWDE